jgi:hypothetical protein
MKPAIQIIILIMVFFMPGMAFSQSDPHHAKIYPILNELKKTEKKLTYIADDLEKINIMTIVPEERQMIRDTVGQLFQIITRCHYEIQLLGVSKMISDNYREFYYQERNNGLQSSKDLIKNNFTEIELSQEKIVNKAALLQIDKAKETILHALGLFEKSITVLQQINK